MSKLFETVEQMAASGYVFRIVDNGGATADRYTVAFCDGSYLALSGAPTHPQGFSQSGDGLGPQYLSDAVESGTQVDLALGDLPRNIVEHIMHRNNEGFAHFVEIIEARQLPNVAPSRSKAKVNEGLRDSLGDGIYLSKGAYHIRSDGRKEDDLGPYATAREALIATLPQACDMAGEEYHSTVNVECLEPTEGVSEQVARLEKIADVIWDCRHAGLNPNEVLGFALDGTSVVIWSDETSEAVNSEMTAQEYLASAEGHFLSENEADRIGMTQEEAEAIRVAAGFTAP